MAPPTLYIHIEEPSMEITLEALLPKLLNQETPWKLINHGSKDQLERVAGFLIQDSQTA